MELFQHRLPEILGNSSAQEQQEWIRAQGPYAPSMFDYLEEVLSHRDLFVFFSYLYAHTYFGVGRVGKKAALVPMAHDEPPLALQVYDSVFRSVQYLLFNTPEERSLVERRFASLDTPGRVVGVGYDPVPAEPADGDGLRVQRSNRAASPAAGAATSVSSEWDRLTRGPFALYVGRIDYPKGLAELFHYYVHSGANIDLILAGENLMGIPSHPRIHYLGVVSEVEKRALLARAEFVLLPSPYESLSLLALESWMAGVPVLASAKSEALRGQCLRSQGGLLYLDLDQFRAGVDFLMESKARRARIGLLGRRYVHETYTWRRVERGYMEALKAVATANA